jgi:uncharacterized protein (TIGR03118 family)
MSFVRSVMFQAVAALAVAVSAAGQSYKVTNLVSDGSVPAITTDASFKNPWGISASGTWWISTAGSGFNYVIPAATNAISFKVIVPTAAAPNTAPGLPAGSVTTAGTVGLNLTNGTKALFLFSTLDGTISGWNPALGTNNAISTVMINNSAVGASYPGMALLNIAAAGVTSKSYILAANFGTGNAIEVYDSNFAPTKLAGNFTDPSLPSGYSPFAVHVLGTQVFVSYAQRTTTAPYRSANGPGNGIVSVFDNTGAFLARVASNGNLNAPWGVAFAPANFGIYSNDLLIGNFGDGKINVFDPKTFAFMGQLIDATGKPLVYASLWELLTGGTAVTGTTAVSGGDTSSVYFTAGLDSEAHGLLASISNGATTGATPTFGVSVANPVASISAGGSVPTQIVVAPVNSFSGTVSLACSGLPTGANCTFSPATVSVSSTTPSVASVTITTTGSSAAAHPLRIQGVFTGITTALLLPFAALLGFRRNRSVKQLAVLRILGMGLLLVVSAAVTGGCSGNGSNSSQMSTPPVAATPSGTSNVTITATAGTVSQTTTVALTIK